MSAWILLTLVAVACEPAAQQEAVPQVKEPNAAFAKLLSDIYSDDAAAREKATVELRRTGPSSMEGLLTERDHVVALYREVTDGDAAVAFNRKLAKLDDAIDQVAQQRHAGHSRLFWHTDLAAAKEAAKASGKPILSLRLLGKLTDDLSCANSRFFRTTLYPNREVSEFLRANYILHWQTFRDVPRVTIDFGNGKKIERTLTGNSIHWILDGEGRPIDALPGLYSPVDFLKGLKTGVELRKILANTAPENRAKVLADAHGFMADQSTRVWLSELRQVAPEAAAAATATKLDEARARLNGAMQASNQVVGPQTQAAPSARATTPVAAPNPPAVNPPAAAAAPIAITKSRVEIPILRNLALMQKLTTATSDDQWEKLAGLHRAATKLDSESRKLIKKQQPLAAFRYRGKDLDVAMEAMFDRLEREISFDSTRNEFLFHNQIHDWYRAGAGNQDVDTLNARVYRELFLTSEKDPFAGLVSPETFTGIDRGGLVEKK